MSNPIPEIAEFSTYDEGLINAERGSATTDLAILFRPKI